MWEFVRTRRADLDSRGVPASDLPLYYVGHGGFSDSDVFFLSTRSTNEDDPLASSITAESLGRLVREGASGLRTYLVLDCCFAASASKVFMSAGPVGIAGAQLAEALPPQGDAMAGQAGRLPAYGTALLCASGPREPAKAPARPALYDVYRRRAGGSATRRSFRSRLALARRYAAAGEDAAGGAVRRQSRAAAGACTTAAQGPGGPGAAVPQSGACRAAEAIVAYSRGGTCGSGYGAPSCRPHIVSGGIRRNRRKPTGGPMPHQHLPNRRRSRHGHFCGNDVAG